ncbi:MAG: VWA domain-containing protein [Rhodococcus sp. (in: high G+C Gram-positive bacteria)]
MGEHRRAGSVSGGRRGVSRGLVVLVVTLALLAAAVFGWLALRDRIADEGAQAAKACVEGEATLAVTADPDIADAVRDVAEAFDATEPVVRDYCVRTSVTERPSTVVADALMSADYDAAIAGSRPSLWIPTDSASAVGVIGDRGAASTPRPLATSPVVLAVAPALADTLGAAAVGWGDLPRLSASPNSLDSIGAVGWGSLRPAFPSGTSTSSALVAVASSVADPTATASAPLTAEQSSAPAVVNAISTLSRAATAANNPTPDDVNAALDLMVRGGDPAGSSVHAVPVTEQQLYGRISEGQQLAAYRPAGATPIADHPAVVLSDADETQRAAAADFVEFARGVGQRDAFLDRGFRLADDATPTPISGLDFPALGQPAATPDPAARNILLTTLASPVRPSSTTVLLDVSGSMESVDGGATRLSNVSDALRQVVDTAPESDRLGLWTYSSALDGNNPYRVVQPLSPMTADPRGALAVSLSGLDPATATSTYASVQAAYASAVANWTGDGPNSVLLITDGPNDDTSISSDRFLSSIAAAADPARPVRIDVVSLTDNTDIATLRALTGQTGGEVVEVSSSDPTLAATLERLTAAR